VLVVLPRAAAPPAGRRGADALPRLRLTRVRLQHLGAAALSGLLLALALPPFDVAPLAFVALVPLLWAWRTEHSGDAALTGLVFGLVYYGIVLGWSRHFGILAFVALVPANAICFVVIGAFLGLYTRRGFWSPWLVAAVWVVGEGLRNRWVLGGMPWGEAGLALHDVTWGRALATWAGIPLASFVVVATNGWLLALGSALRRHRRPVVPAVSLAVVVVFVAGAWALRPEPTVTGNIRFALLQGDDLNRELTPQEEADNLLTERHFALADQLEGRYDLVVFPESALERDPERDPALRRRIIDLAQRLDATVLVNARTAAPDGGLFNANLAYEPDGRLQGQYAKRHLVPFGEYIPYREYLDWIPELDRVSFDYTPGEGRTQFTAGGHPFETVICYESAYPQFTRDAARHGAELLVVSTSNRSFGRSSLSAQHVALGQMRAAETGRPLLHAAISGITAVIDADGHVVERTGLFEPATTEGRIATTTGTTPFVRFGDWVVAASLIGMLVTAIVVQRRWVRRDPS